MEFTFDTVIDRRALTAMAKTLRKTIRKKRSRRSHIFGWLVVAAALLLALMGQAGDGAGVRGVVTWLAICAIVAALLWEDPINGYVAQKRMMPGTERAASTFRADSYTTVTAVGETGWHYDTIRHLAKTGDYYVFVFSQSHAQIYDARTLSGGTRDEFEAFMEARTGKLFETVE